MPKITYFHARKMLSKILARLNTANCLTCSQFHKKKLRNLRRNLNFKHTVFYFIIKFTRPWYPDLFSINQINWEKNH